MDRRPPSGDSVIDKLDTLNTQVTALLELVSDMHVELYTLKATLDDEK